MAEWQIDDRGNALNDGGCKLLAPDQDNEAEFELEFNDYDLSKYIPFSVLQAYVRFHEDAKARAWEAEREEFRDAGSLYERAMSSPPAPPQIIDPMEALKAGLAAAGPRKTLDVAEDVDNDEAGLDFVRGYEGDR